MAAAADVDEAGLLERTQRLADGDATDREALGQLARGGKRSPIGTTLSLIAWPSRSTVSSKRLRERIAAGSRRLRSRGP